jgi:hypothetical protein
MYEQLKNALETMSEMTLFDIEGTTNLRAVFRLKEVLSQHFPDQIAEEISLCAKIDLPQGLGLDELEGLIQPYAATIVKLDKVLSRNGYRNDAILKLASRLILELKT